MSRNVTFCRGKKKAAELPAAFFLFTRHAVSRASLGGLGLLLRLDERNSAHELQVDHALDAAVDLEK
jgi:hypothetical protein